MEYENTTAYTGTVGDNTMLKQDEEKMTPVKK